MVIDDNEAALARGPHSTRLRAMVEMGSGELKRGTQRGAPLLYQGLGSSIR